MIEWTSHACARLEEGYTETCLPCGLRILVCPKDRATYHAAVSVGYGSMDRFAHRDGGRALPMGTAHFLEHKMFERDPALFHGSDSYDDDFAACGAESNAYTSHDRTVYYFSCTDRFPDALTALLSMVSELYVTSESVARERDIIAEEIRMNADDPWERCCAAARTALFGKHPVQEEICGSEASIRRITPAVLREAFDTFYRPDNMVLTVCGRVTPEDVYAMAQTVMERFRFPNGEQNAFPTARPRIPVKPAVFSSRTATRRPVSKPIFCIGVKCPDLPVGREALWRRDLTMSALCETLFSHAGDFYSDLFERGLVSPGMSYGYLVGDSPRLPAKLSYGYFDLSGESDCPETVFGEFLSFAERIRKNGIPEEDLARAKRILYAEFVAGFDTTEDIAALLCSYAADGLCAYDFLAVLDSITLADVEELFGKTFRDSQYTLSVVLPSEENQ